MVLHNLRTMSKAPMAYAAAAVLAALATLCIAQESVSVSSVNGVSEGSTQISSELWTISPSAAQCPAGTPFPAQGISGVATISHLKNATADDMILKVLMRAQIPSFGGLFVGGPSFAWSWTDSDFVDAYSIDAVWSPPEGFLLQLKDSTGRKFVRMLANFTMAINPWQAQGFQVYGIQANSCPGAPSDCIGPACNATQPVH